MIRIISHKAAMMSRMLAAVVRDIIPRMSFILLSLGSCGK
jgi:hypothetical protein